MDEPTPEFIAQAVKYYTAVLESKKRAWKLKHPEPKPRGRPRKGGGVVVESNKDQPVASPVVQSV
jgi:hypothetical protein